MMQQDISRPRPEPSPTLRSFATLVRDLRTVQAANGLGYKDPAGAQQAAALEAKVNADLDRILGPATAATG